MESREDTDVLEDDDDDDPKDEECDDSDSFP